MKNVYVSYTESCILADMFQDLPDLTQTWFVKVFQGYTNYRKIFMFNNVQRLCIISLVVFVGFSFATSMLSFGQHVAPTKRFVFDHEAYESNKQILGPQELNAGMMGDFVNLDTGELSFSQTDVDLPGNFDIPVRFTRIIDGDDDRPKFVTSELAKKSTGLANWGAELPYILLHAINKDGKVGCVSATHALNEYDKMHVIPRLSLRHNQRWTLLKSSKTSIFGTVSPEFTTKTLWKLSQTKINGKCTWKAIAPNGNIYEFGQPYILAKRSDGAKKHAVLITKITDVHGNWVKYDYDETHKRLKEITSSDGRKIRLVYRSNNELECIVVNGRMWVYKFKKINWNSSEKYLSKATLPDGRYWEFGKLLGVTSFSSSFHAQRCIFGEGARIRHFEGTVATYKTQKIINFASASSPAHLKTSHRATCLPPIELFGKNFKGGIYKQILRGEYYPSRNSPEYEAEVYIKGRVSQYMSTASLTDGVSKFGYFSTFFTSAVVEKKLQSVDGTTITWTYDYDEGDLYNGDYSYETSSKSVHKGSKIVQVDTSKPKKRTVTGPLGTKYEYYFGRGLTDTGALISEHIYPKGSTEASRKVSYEYVFSAIKLGMAWNCTMVTPVEVKNPAEYWRRVSKRTVTQDGEVYTTLNNYDSRGSLTKSTKSSTIQDGADVIVRKVKYLDSKWILDLTGSITEDGKEIRGFTYDVNGKVILETRYGNQYERTKWNSDGTRAAVRDGNNHTTKFENYKRGISQKVIKPNGGIYQKTVDSNGWITSETNVLGYKESFTFDNCGRVTKIDRPTGYADSIITYSIASADGGRAVTVTTGTGKQKIIEKTTFDLFGNTVLKETRDVTNSVSVFVRHQFDKLGRPIFESLPSSKSSTTLGIKATFDSLSRVTSLKLSVSPFPTIAISYLSDNRIKIVDASGNAIVRHRSGFGSPDDGNVVLIEFPDGTKTSISHDSWQNITMVQLQADGRTLTRSYKYDSRLQLCMQSIPESGTEAFTYNAVGRKVTSEKGVSSTYTCETPIAVYIKDFPREIPTTKPTTPTPTPKPPPTCGYYMVWVPSYNKCMNVGIVTQCGSEILTSATKNGCAYNTACASYPYSINKPSFCFKNYIANSPLFSDPVTTNIVRFGYNSDGLLTSVDYPDDTPDIANSYDLGENLVKTVSGKVTNTYTYGKRNELKSETMTIDNHTYTVAYGYNSVGGRISYTSPSGKRVTFTRNAFNQVTGLSIDSVDYVTNANYYPNGVLKEAILHNLSRYSTTPTITVSNLLNSRLLVSETKLTTNKSPIVSFSNTYFKDGRLKTVVDTLDVSNGIGNRTFTYNIRGYISTADGPLGITTYIYDGFSNLLSQTNGSLVIEVTFDNTTNRVKAYKTTNIDNEVGSPEIFSISNSKAGQLQQLRLMKLSYDDADHLISAKKSGDFEDRSYFDGNDNRYKVVENRLGQNGGTKTRHLFNSIEGSLLSQIAIGAPGSSGKTFSDLINFDENLSLHVFTCSHWIYHNPNNNYVVALRPDNSIAEVSSIGPFGNTWDNRSQEENESTDPCASQSVLMASTLSSNENTTDRSMVNNFLFRHVHRDENSKLYFLATKRFYDAFGQYLTPESTVAWQNGLATVNFEQNNLYAIANNDPTNLQTRDIEKASRNFLSTNKSLAIPMAYDMGEQFIEKSRLIVTR